MPSSSRYDSGAAKSYQQWIGKYANCDFDYFARHRAGQPVKYQFNSKGWRGPEHYEYADIYVFGSSFSFGVGMDWSQCWHQQLGNYRVNCYAPAGFLVTNNDIIDYYKQLNPSAIIILQLREFEYNVAPIDVPENIHCFVVDKVVPQNFVGFRYSTFVDHANDQTHPGPRTHQLWSKIIKKMFNL